MSVMVDTSVGLMTLSFVATMLVMIVTVLTEKRLRQSEDLKIVITEKIAVYEGNLKIVHRPRLTGDETSHAPKPPSRHARQTLLLLTKYKDQIAILGDLDEMFYAEIQPKYGNLFAQIWYWLQIARAVGVIRWAAIIKIGMAVKRFIS